MAFFQSKTLWVNQLADGVAALVLDSPAARVNTLDAQLLQDLDEALERISHESFELLIVRSAKPTSFCHGLDFNMLAALRAPDDFVALARRGQEICERLAQLPMPCVAVIAGSCLGAGLELALACDYRVVLDRPKVRLGFTHLDLGLLPAWGGTQRLPRLLGLEASLPLLLGTRRLSPREAVARGLADELATENDDRPPSFLTQPRKRAWSHCTRRTWRQRLLEATAFGRRALLRGAERVLLKRLPDALPAPVAVLQALRVAATSSAWEAGWQFEREAFGRLAASPAFRNLLSFQQQRARQRDALAACAEQAQPRRVAVLGSGALSVLLLFQAVTHGQEVLIRAGDEGKLGIALLGLIKALEAAAQAGKLSSAELHKCMSAIKGTYTWTHFDGIELALDTTIGSLADQQALLAEVAAHAAPEALLVSASALHSVGALQEGLPQPGRSAGLYFVEPREPGAIVEVVRTPATAPETERRLISWCAALRFTPVSVADSPGRLVLRILMPALNEAALLVREGMSIARVDAALRRFGLTHGPLEYLDLLGLDGAAALAESLPSLFAGRLTFETGFALMAERGWLGKKAELGFYRYRARHRSSAHAQAENLWRAESRGEPARALPALSELDQRHLAQDRLVALMLLEAARCLDEGIVPTARELDLTLCQVIWPAHRAGPLGYARAQPPGALAARFQTLEREYGARFALTDTTLGILCG
jgi:3-hydroxyacyl-CoA dehydrogenase / enoyl-CoA hydratase / 3-hydroxybutyryl-CoA epimerase